MGFSAVKTDGCEERANLKEVGFAVIKRVKIAREFFTMCPRCSKCISASYPQILTDSTMSVSGKKIMNE